ncbi:MAG: DinB family protein [Terriglobia bacterium]
MTLLRSLSTAVIGLLLTSAAGAAPTAADVFNRQLKSAESEVVPLIEAMPADKFGFAPTNGNFKGVRTFAQEAKHVAYVLNEVAAGMLGEKNPSTTGKNENGPDNLMGRDEIVKYVKDAFAYAHKAMSTLTNENLMGEITDPFDAKKKSTRVSSASIMLWHSYDHYGQMVEYLRMNGIIPPASR